jgi:hypothetical protein
MVPAHTGVPCRTVYQVHENNIEGTFTAGSLLVQIDSLLTSHSLGIVGRIDATFLYEHSKHLQIYVVCDTVNLLILTYLEIAVAILSSTRSILGWVGSFDPSSSFSSRSCSAVPCLAFPTCAITIR